MEVKFIDGGVHGLLILADGADEGFESPVKRFAAIFFHNGFKGLASGGEAEDMGSEEVDFFFRGIDIEACTDGGAFF